MIRRLLRWFDSDTRESQGERNARLEAAWDAAQSPQVQAERAEREQAERLIEVRQFLATCGLKAIPVDTAYDGQRYLESYRHPSGDLETVQMRAQVEWVVEDRTKIAHQTMITGDMLVITSAKIADDTVGEWW